MSNPSLLLSFLFLLAHSAVAQTPVEPELVQPGVISTDLNETFPFIDPIDGSLWFSVYTEDFDAQTVMHAAQGDAGWLTPSVAWFSGSEWGDRAARFSPDGKRMYFSSSRPTPTSPEGGGYHLWVIERQGDEWSEPRLLPEPVNSTGNDYHSSETRAGELYWASNRPGGAGRSDIYRALREGGNWSAAEHLPTSINDSLSQPDLLVSPDGDWMILVVTRHPAGLGGDDLFVSRLEDGRWSAPQVLPAPINSDKYDYGPSLSPDGGTLYFTSHRRGSADVYRIPVSALGLPTRP